MRIAVLGTGNVGTALAGGWAGAGHEIVFGSRDPDGARARAAVGKVPGATAQRQDDAVVAADVVVIATPPDAAVEVARAAGGLDGRIVVDVTNAVAPEDGALTVARSMASAIAAAAPGARVVKAFNTIGFEHVQGPDFGAVRPVMLVAGGDPDARALVLGLARDLGFDAVDAGPLGNAIHLEHLAALWIWLATRGGRGRGIAFALLER
jgi:8-hydroxy-5-deazaflavin:NADPH oxidoreductase